MEDDDFEIFAEGAQAIPGGMEEMMEMINRSIEEHGMTFDQAIGILLDLVRPGNSENSHDVKALFVGAMFAYGQGPLALKFGSLYLNSMPWGIGFQIAVEQGLIFTDLSQGQQQAVVRSLCVVLQAGGLNAAVDENNRIILTGPDGETSSVDIDSIVSQFREQMDVELGPDGPEVPMRRWMP